MISSEVQRTLVKSPPELWAELGDPASLARHLGELGEIRITRIDPEQAVEWETEDATGTVLIKPSAWGTKVTLTVTREASTAEPPLATHPPAQAGQAVEPEPAAAFEPEPAAGTELVPEIEVTAEIEPEPAAELDTESAPQCEAEPAMDAEPEPAVWDEASAGVEAQHEPTLQSVAEPEPELLPRRGFLSRLFGRRPRKVAVEPEPADQYAPVASWEPEPAEPSEPPASLEPEPPEAYAPVASLEPEPPEAYAPVAEQIEQPAESLDSSSQEISAQLEQAEEAAAGEVTAVLTAVLDRLGAAHHRPFSRG